MKKWEIIHTIRKTYLCDNIDIDKCLPTIREFAEIFSVSRGNC